MLTELQGHLISTLCWQCHVVIWSSTFTSYVHLVFILLAYPRLINNLRRLSSFRCLELRWHTNVTETLRWIATSSEVNIVRYVRINERANKPQPVASWTVHWYAWKTNICSSSTGVTHVWITLVNDQLDAQLFYFVIRLLQSSTCFEQRRAHHQEVKLY